MVLLLIPVWVSAQETETKRFVARGISIESAIIKLVETEKIDLVYDPTLPLKDIVYVSLNYKTPSEALREILKGSKLDFIILSSGTYVITEKRGIQKDYGRFYGYVFDAETGSPISNATVFLSDASNSTYTNQNGYFSVNSLITGSYPVIFSSIGYESQRATVSVDADSEVKVIRLSPKTFLGDPIVVQAQTPSLSLNKLAEGVDFQRSFERQPSAQESPIKATSVYSGISFNESQQTLSIQGGNPENQLVKLDGVPMYGVGNLGTHIGSFSPYAIDKVYVKKAGYGVDDGGVLSGIVDFRQTAGSSSNRLGLIQINPNSINGVFSPSIHKKWNTSLVLRNNQVGGELPYGYRTNVQSRNLLDPLTQNFLMGGERDIAHYDQQVQNQSVNFFDSHFTAETSTSDFQRTILSGYFGSQRFTNELLSERNTINSNQPFFVYSQENGERFNSMLQLSRYQVLSERADISFQGYYSGSSFSNIYFMEGNDSLYQAGHSADDAFQFYSQRYNPNASLVDEQSIQELGANAALVYHVDSRLKLTNGLETQFLSYDFGINDLFYFPIENSNSVLLTSFYSQSEFTISRNLRASFGARSTFSTSNQQLYIQPRFSLTFDSEKTPIGFHTVSLSGGVYRQFIHQLHLTNVGPSAFTTHNDFTFPIDNSLTIPASYQVSGLWEVSVSELTSFSFETYYKWTPTLYEVSYQRLLVPQINRGQSFTSQDEFLMEAEGYSFGGALTFIQTFENPDIQLKWLNQSNISKRRNSERFNGSQVHAFWSEPFSSTLSLRYQTTERLSFSAFSRWTPTRYWAFNHAYYDFLTTHGETQLGSFNLNDPDDHTLSPFFQIDLSANYSMNISRSRLKFRMDLVNITNRKNELSRFLTPHSQTGGNIYETSSKRLPGFIPTFSVQFEI